MHNKTKAIVLRQFLPAWWPSNRSNIFLTFLMAASLQSSRMSEPEYPSVRWKKTNINVTGRANCVVKYHWIIASKTLLWGQKNIYIERRLRGREGAKEDFYFSNIVKLIFGRDFGSEKSQVHIRTLHEKPESVIDHNGKDITSSKVLKWKIKTSPSYCNDIKC